MKTSLESIKSEFPLLKNKVYGKEIVYLDNAASSQKPKKVIEEINRFYSTYNANVHRGIYKISMEASKAYEDSREIVKNFINAKSSKEIIFTKGATESLNLLAYTLCKKLKKGDEILITEMEHHSNLVPWQILAKQYNLKLRFVSLNKDGTLGDIQLSKKTKIVSLTHISNALGTINNIKEIAKKVHDNNSIIIVDGAQSVPHVKVDVQDLDIDFLAFSGHKMLASTGVGVLYGKESLLETLDPFLAGGDMIKEVKLDNTTYNDLPWRFEAGTPNIEGVISLKYAIEFLNSIGMDNIEKLENELKEYAYNKLSKVNNIEIYGPSDIIKRSSIVSFNIKGAHAHDVATILDEHGICVRSGHHCCQPLMNSLNIPGTCRASFYIYNTKKDVDKLAEVLDHVNKIFNR